MDLGCYCAFWCCCGSCLYLYITIQEKLHECPGYLILLNSATISHLVTSSGYMIASSKYIYALCLLPGSVFWACFTFKLIAKVWANLKKVIVFLR